MHTAIGPRGSVNWHNVVLRNWAKRWRVDIGKQGFRGWSLFATGKAFVIEHRGPPLGPVHLECPFEPGVPREHPDHRNYAFDTAKPLFLRLSQQEP